MDWKEHPRFKQLMADPEFLAYSQKDPLGANAFVAELKADIEREAMPKSAPLKSVTAGMVTPTFGLYEAAAGNPAPANAVLEGIGTSLAGTAIGAGQIVNKALAALGLAEDQSGTFSAARNEFATPTTTEGAATKPIIDLAQFLVGPDKTGVRGLDALASVRPALGNMIREGVGTGTIAGAQSGSPEAGLQTGAAAAGIGRLVNALGQYGQWTAGKQYARAFQLAGPTAKTAAKKYLPEALDQGLGGLSVRVDPNAPLGRMFSRGPMGMQELQDAMTFRSAMAGGRLARAYNQPGLPPVTPLGAVQGVTSGFKEQVTAKGLPYVTPTTQTTFTGSMVPVTTGGQSVTPEVIANDAVIESAKAIEEKLVSGNLPIQFPPGQVWKLRKELSKIITGATGGGEKWDQGTKLTLGRMQLKVERAIDQELKRAVPDAQKLSDIYAFTENMQRLAWSANIKNVGSAGGMAGGMSEVAGPAGAVGLLFGDPSRLGKAVLFKNFMGIVTHPTWRMVSATVKNDVAKLLSNGDLQGAITRLGAAGLRPPPEDTSGTFSPDKIGSILDQLGPTSPFSSTPQQGMAASSALKKGDYAAFLQALT